MEENRITSSTELFAGGPPSREDYLTALMAEALNRGRITPDEERELRRRIVELLVRRMMLFTDGESTSLREETAQRLLSSVLYTVGIALLDTGSYEAALAALRERKMEELHDAGMRITMRTKKRAEVIALLLLRTQRPEQSEGYNRFVGRDAYRYVRSYDALYNARAELSVRIDELGIREICGGMLRVAEVMTEVLRYNQRAAR